jgi:hypothetical protein
MRVIDEVIRDGSLYQHLLLMTRHCTRFTWSTRTRRQRTEGSEELADDFNAFGVPFGKAGGSARTAAHSQYRPVASSVSESSTITATIRSTGGVVCEFELPDILW